MFKLIATDAAVSKGYGNNPALRFFDGENGSSVHFRIGKRVYDSRCEGNHRWVNINVKAFGDVCERIKKMKLKEGSFVNIIGRYDEEVKEDQSNNEKRSYPVVIVEDIEYCYSGGSQKNGQSSAAQGAPNQGQPSAPPQGQPSPPPAPMPGNFTGYEGLYGGENPYF